MKKIIYYIILTVIIGLLSGCSAKSGTSANTGVESGGKTDSDSDAKNDGEKDTVLGSQVIKVDDLMTTIEWIGKTHDEIGPEVKDTEKYFDISGSFLGGKAGGSGSFNDKNSAGEPVVSRITFTVGNSSVSDYYNKLMELYGGAVNEGMEPYAEDNGGAVEWYTFDAGEVLIKISQGSKVNYVTVNFEKNPEPSNTGKLVLQTYPESDLMTLQLDMFMKATDYKDGILTVAITNQMGTDMTYTDSYILAKSSDNGQTYAHLNRMGNQFMPEEDPVVYEIADTKTQELECDLRVFGRIEAGKYMIIIDDMTAEFQLVSEDEAAGKTPIAPWFCPECGKKNIDTDVCTECGSSR